MLYGVCLLSVVPLRAEPRESSEQVSQLVFGDSFSVLELNDQRAYVELTFDGYRGWVDRKQIIMIDNRDYFMLTRSKPLYSVDFVSQILIRDLRIGLERRVNVPFGSRFFSNEYVVGDFMVRAKNVLLSTELAFSEKNLMKYVNLFLNAPYQWGGKTVFATDCSGFVQSIFKLFGVGLLRDASMQVTQGKQVDSLQEAKAGDLAFFVSDKAKVVHVGILLAPTRIVHASAWVRIDDIDAKGIIRKEDGLYSHKLFQIRRYFH